MKKLNEVAIFESFRIQPSKDEKIEVERIKKQFKESPISTTGWMILEGIAAPFVSRADQTVDYYKKTYSNITTVFKSSIRDAAISDVSQRIKKKKKKAYEIKKKDLEKMILKEEERIKEKGRLSLIKKIILIHLGVGILPFF
jgi:hypothetical protein|tara:strand:- start:875 stop:1300 length:426 start_codon:yes stop_codon:yes gene_type:complete